tara:strand:+ start:107 stop:286 length:180 start_codon:yes stop_codon:yes gene_type:complete
MTYTDAVRIYQHKQRDNDLPYNYPSKLESSEHIGFWVLRDDNGSYITTVAKQRGKDGRY